MTARDMAAQDMAAQGSSPARQRSRTALRHGAAIAAGLALLVPLVFDLYKMMSETLSPSPVGPIVATAAVDVLALIAALTLILCGRPVRVVGIVAVVVTVVREAAIYYATIADPNIGAGLLRLGTAILLAVLGLVTLAVVLWRRRRGAPVG